MNIVLVSQTYPPETAGGGIASQTSIKAKGLAALGHTIHVISHSNDGKRHERTASDIHVIRIPGFEDRMPEMTEIVRWLTYSMLVSAEIEKLQREIKIDIIDFPEWAAEGYVYLLNRRDWSFIPVVIQLHGPLVMFGHEMDWPDMNSPFYLTGTQMEATCVQLADGVYSSSKCSAQWVRQYYSPGKSEIPVIHTGVDTAFFSPQPVKKYSNPTIIFNGKIVPNKGIAELVEAAICLSKEMPDLRLRIIGKGETSFIDKLRKMTELSCASDLLEFPGFFPSEALPAELSRGHVFAAPSWYEGGPGFVYLEAMACGLPVIACSGSGIEENVIHGHNGFLVAPKNSEELKLALEKILTNKHLSSEMGSNARNYVVSNCNSIYYIKKLEEYYSKIIQNRR